MLLRESNFSQLEYFPMTEKMSVLVLLRLSKCSLYGSRYILRERLLIHTNSRMRFIVSTICFLSRLVSTGALTSLATSIKHALLFLITFFLYKPCINFPAMAIECSCGACAYLRKMACFSRIGYYTYLRFKHFFTFTC